MKYYIVKLGGESWLAPWVGDPGRTVVMENARLYKTHNGANIALAIAKKKNKHRDLSLATICPVEVEIKINRK